MLQMNPLCLLKGRKPYVNKSTEINMSLYQPLSTSAIALSSESIQLNHAHSSWEWRTWRMAIRRYARLKAHDSETQLLSHRSYCSLGYLMIWNPKGETRRGRSSILFYMRVMYIAWIGMYVVHFVYIGVLWSFGRGKVTDHISQTLLHWRTLALITSRVEVFS